MSGAEWRWSKTNWMNEEGQRYSRNEEKFTCGMSGTNKAIEWAPMEWALREASGSINSMLMWFRCGSSVALSAFNNFNLFSLERIQIKLFHAAPAPTPEFITLQAFVPFLPFVDLFYFLIMPLNFCLPVKLLSGTSSASAEWNETMSSGMEQKEKRTGIVRNYLESKS